LDLRGTEQDHSTLKPRWLSAHADQGHSEGLPMSNYRMSDDAPLYALVIVVIAGAAAVGFICWAVLFY
jgi:hypothetical protein